MTKRFGIFKVERVVRHTPTVAEIDEELVELRGLLLEARVREVEELAHWLATGRRSGGDG